MSFNLEVSFTGLCLFVPNKAGTKMCVVLPNGEGAVPHPKKSSVDPTMLFRHRAFLRFDMKNLKGMSKVPEDSIAVWHLTRRVLKIDEDADNAKNPFNKGDLKTVLSLPDIAPAYSVPDPDVIAGDTKKITSRLLIEKGEITAGEPATDSWRVPPTLSGKVVRYPELATRVILKINGMKKLTLSVSAMSGGTSQEPLHLEAPEGETVKITIMNFCDKNPLQWTPQLQSAADIDFKWYFELPLGCSIESIGRRTSGSEAPRFPCPRGSRPAVAKTVSWPSLGRLFSEERRSHEP